MYFGNVNVFIIPHISQSQGGLEFWFLCRGEIGRQHVKASLVTSISPYIDLTHPPKPVHEYERQMKSEIEIDHHTAWGVLTFGFLLSASF